MDRSGYKPTPLALFPLLQMEPRMVERVCQGRGAPCRVVVNDGSWYTIELGTDPRRVNLAVEGGKVAAAWFG